MDRRSFCRKGAAAAAVWGGVAARGAGWPFGAGSGGLDVGALDRRRVLRAADEYLLAAPETIVLAHSARSGGGLHDYFSEGEDWWPDPDAPNGPYVRHEGMSNPDAFRAHREVLVRMSVMVPALAAAWLLTRQVRYAEAAATHLRAWFLNPTTRMNPSLEYAGAVQGVAEGRSVGIADTVQLVEPARAAGLLLTSGVFSPQEMVGLHGWFAQYLTWLTTSAKGLEAREQKGPGGSSWVLQVAAFAAFTRNGPLLSECRDRFRQALIPEQVAANGSLPLALNGNQPYADSLVSLDYLATIAQIATIPRVSLFAFATADGRGLRRAMGFMVPFIQDKQFWPYPYDRQNFNALPVRQPSLLFGGLAYSNEAYLALWKRLDPDPKVSALVQQFAIRQPVLWV